MSRARRGRRLAAGRPVGPAAARPRAPRLPPRLARRLFGSLL